MLIKRDFTSIFLFAVVNTAGIPFPKQAGAKYIELLKYYHLYSFLCLTSCQLFMLARCENIVSASLTMVFILNGIFLNSLTLSLHLKKKNIFSMYNLIFNDFGILYPKNNYSANERFKRFFRVYGTMYYVIYVISIGSPVLFLPFSKKKLGDPNTLLIPCQFPWKIDTYPKYIATVFLQFSWLGPLSLPVTLNIMFIFYFIIESRVQFSLLNNNVKKLSSKSKSSQMSHHPWERNSEYDELQYSYLKNIIKHQQKIIRFIENFKNCYNLAFSANLIYSVANLSLLLLVMNVGEKSLVYVLQSFAAFLMSMMYLFMFCSVGQILQDLHVGFRTSLYNTLWFESSPKFRKTFTLAMCSTLITLNLRAGSSYVASYELFFNILRMSYSFYNLLAQSFSISSK